MTDDDEEVPKNDEEVPKQEPTLAMTITITEEVPMQEEPQEDTTSMIIWLKIRVPWHGDTRTLYFNGHATHWEDVKKWVSQTTGVPSTLFFLIRSADGTKLNYDAPIRLGHAWSWPSVTVVLKEF